MMKQFSLVTLILMLFSSLVFSVELHWEEHWKEADQLVSQGQFEKAVKYLSDQTKRSDIHPIDKWLDALNAFNLTAHYSDQKEGLFIVKPVYEEFVKKFGENSSLSFYPRQLLIKAYLKRGEHDKAEHYAQLLIQYAKTEEKRAEAYLSLGNVYEAKKEATKSLDAYLKSEALFKKINLNGKYNGELGSIYNNMAFNYEAVGKYEKAIASFKTSLKMEPIDTNGYYNSLYNLSRLYQRIGQVDKAKKGLVDTAAFYLKTEGENSYHYIMLQNELGVLEDDYGHYEEAINYYQAVLNYGERLDRQEIKALGLKNMASAYVGQGRLSLAASCFQKALTIYQQMPPSLSIANNYEGLASLASETNSFQKEIMYYEKALEIYRALHHENQPAYAQVLVNKGMAYQKQKQSERAQELYLQAFEIFQKIEPRGRKMGFLYVNWATLHIHQRQYRKAESMLLEALKFLRESAGEKHPDMAYAYNNLAHLYTLQRENSKAIACYEKAVKIAEASLGFNHASTRLYRGNLLKTKIVKRFSRSRFS